MDHLAADDDLVPVPGSPFSGDVGATSDHSEARTGENIQNQPSIQRINIDLISPFLLVS